MNNEKSITPNAPADFTPTLGKYNDLQPFRYWCHKVLPLVYDDSLSYYELLCKVVAYLNDTMEDVETLHGDITKLHSVYAELQSYVNNYFSSLDVQEEINNKLDNMASSGELYEIIIKVYVTPEMFGAKGDGVTDDTVAIQNAVNAGKNVVFPSGVYKISSTIEISGDTSIYGCGSKNSIIVYDGSGYAFSFKNDTIKWHEPSVFVKDLCIQSVNGTVKFSNITQGTISNCKLVSTSNRDDVYNVFLSNESHYSRVINCFISGSVGIYNDSPNTSNGVTIQNNYITYSKIGVYLNGYANHLIANDLEGYTDLPYKLHCSDSILECFGERNSMGKWIEINGSSNIITVGMSSAGGSAYIPLLSIDGDCNTIDIITASGYSLFEKINGTGNTIKARRILSIQNYPIIGPSEIIECKQKNLFVDDNIPLLFDIENDDIRNYITSGEYTYDETNKQIILTGSETLNINFSSLVGDEPYFIYYEGEGISNKGHFYPVIKTDGDSGRDISIGDSLVFVRYPSSTNIYNAFNSSGVSWKIKKLKVAKYFTKKLFN